MSESRSRYISIPLLSVKPCVVKKEERVIIRRKKERDFTIIGNSFAQDKALSWKSRGLFLYIYSLPEDWNIHETELLNHSPDGRYGTHAALEELIHAGYVFKTQGEDIRNQTYFFVDDERHTAEEWESLIEKEVRNNQALYHGLVENQHSTTRKTNIDYAENQHSTTRKTNIDYAENQHSTMQKTNIVLCRKSASTKYPNKETDKETDKDGFCFSGSSKTVNPFSPDAAKNGLKTPEKPLGEEGDDKGIDDAPEGPPHATSGVFLGLPEAPKAEGTDSKRNPPGDKPIERREDGITVWNRAREFWNNLGLKPRCPDLMMRRDDQDDILRTFAAYGWDEIKNAIDNFAWHKLEATDEYEPPPPYQSLSGFLKTGVEKYHDDEAFKQLFRRERK